jgi:D-apiose dehydrogenase
VLDIARFLHGEAHSVYCQTARVNPSIRGEDVANLSMRMTSGLHCLVELSYASKLEKEAFPQTLVSVEGSKGSVHLSHDFMLTTVTGEGNSMINCGPVLYDWCDPAYGVVHSSIVDCNRNILEGLRGGLTETTGADNFKTLQLVFAAYDSASKNEVVQCNQFF